MKGVEYKLVLLLVIDEIHKRLITSQIVLIKRASINTFGFYGLEREMYTH